MVEQLGRTRMIIGVPREIKDKEFRVGIVPEGVRKLCKSGHIVLIESGSGLGSGISPTGSLKLPVQRW